MSKKVFSGNNPLAEGPDEVQKIDKLFGGFSKNDELKQKLIEIPPVFPFRISSPYGVTRSLDKGKAPKIHTGIDFVGWKNNQSVVTEIVAGVQGKVIHASFEKDDPRGKAWGGRGNCITIRSTKNDRVYFCYYHLADIYVKSGQIVTPTTRIGKMGNSGHSFGAHLHFEVKYAGDKHSVSNGLPYPSKHVDPDLFYLGDLNKQSKSIKKVLPTLKKGSKGVDVEYLQELLQELGHQIIADGIFGTGTEDFVKLFQQQHGMTVDGIVGPNTWSILCGNA